MKIPLSLFVLLLGLSSTIAQDKTFPEDISKWVTTTASFAGSHPMWFAANRVGAIWEVYKDGKSIKVRRYDKRRNNLEIKFKDGILVSKNMGEFGASVMWQPTTGAAVEISKYPVKHFFEFSGNLYAFSGIAHMGTNIGQVLRFSREKDTWKIDLLCKLVDEPQLVVIESEKTCLILTYSGLCRVSTDGWIQLLVVSAEWEGLHPRSLVIGDDGFAYVGFSQRVAKVHLISGDTTYLVPYTEIFDEDLKLDSKLISEVGG